MENEKVENTQLLKKSTTNSSSSSSSSANPENKDTHLRAMNSRATDSANDSTGTTTMPIYTNGRFYNPWATWDEQSIWQRIKTARETDAGPSPTIPPDIDTQLPVVNPDFRPFNSGQHDDTHNSAAGTHGSAKRRMQVCWLGHASVLVRFDGLTVLTDPVFSDRCSPVSFIGPKRYRPMPCGVEDLPQVDAVVISHTHYDHLDTGTIKKINARFGVNVHWFVPIKAKSILTCVGCKNVTELSWWDEHKLQHHGKLFNFVFTPTQHFTNRGLTDMNKCLWGSWVVVGPTQRFFFGGDTAYCSGFKEIGNKYGPMDFSAIPIGAYHPPQVMQSIHCNPHEAVQIHLDVRSRRSVGIHWGTFVLTREPILQPPQRLAEALTEQGLSQTDFFVSKHGEVLEV